MERSLWTWYWQRGAWTFEVVIDLGYWMLGVWMTKTPLYIVGHAHFLCCYLAFNRERTIAPHSGATAQPTEGK